MLSVLQPVCKWIQHLFVRTLMWVPIQPVLFFGRWPHGNFRSPFGKGRRSQICFYQVQLGNANFSVMVEIQIQIYNRSVHFLLSQDTCKDSGTQLLGNGAIESEAEIRMAICSGSMQVTPLRETSSTRCMYIQQGADERDAACSLRGKM